MIDWTNFTPWQSLAGGGLIGLAAVILLLTNGRIFGVSGILERSLFSKERAAWRFMVLIGVIAAPWLYILMGGQLAQAQDRPVVLLVLAGLLVGYGSVLGSGCTSGHGVCGISRLSKRSLVATGCFIVSGMFTLYIVRHLLGWV